MLCSLNGLHIVFCCSPVRECVRACVRACEGESEREREREGERECMCCLDWTGLVSLWLLPRDLE
jgi:hypothetical protein